MMLRKRSWISLAAVLLMVGSAAAVPQDGALGRAAETTDPQVNVLRLRSIPADEAASIVHQVLELGDVRLAADSTTNSLVVSTSSLSDFDKIVRLIKQLDVRDEERAPEVKIFALRNASAAEAYNTVLQLLGSDSFTARLTLDQRSNAIIAAGEVDQLAVLEAVLIKLDDQQETEQERTLRTYQLRNAASHSALAVIQTLFAGEQDVRASVDERTNTIMFYGSPAAHERIVEMLQTLDQPAAGEGAAPPRLRDEPQAYKVRILWLAAGEGVQPGMGMTEDLKPVTDELARYGFNDLQVAGQLLANTASQISSGGNVNFAGARYQIQCIGQLEQVGDRVKLGLDVRLLLADLSPEQSNLLTSASTEIFTTPGHYTVLGVSPANDQTAIFVVQVLAD